MVGPQPAQRSAQQPVGPQPGPSTTTGAPIFGASVFGSFLVSCATGTMRSTLSGVDGIDWGIWGGRKAVWLMAVLDRPSKLAKAIAIQVFFNTAYTSLFGIVRIPSPA